MKQKDIAVVIIIAFFSAVLSFVVSNKLFVTQQNRQQTIEIVDTISTEFNRPDSRFFNNQSINPTIDTQLGGNNQNPFNGSTQ